MRFVIPACLILLIACNKKENTPDANPPLSSIPAITIKGLSATTIKALSDTLTIQVSYTDGNGDIGFEHPDSAVVYVTDNRFPITMSYHVPPLSPSGTNVSITGTLPVVVKNIILQGDSTPEIASFSVRLRDRKGNWSNTALTGNVTVVP